MSVDKGYKNIFFVSEIRTPDSNSTSTHLMTESILNGLKDNNFNVTFFAICELPNEKDTIIDYFSRIVDKVIVIPSQFGYNLSSLKNLFCMFKSSYLLKMYRDDLMPFLEMAQVPDIILSHSPSFESVAYSRIIKNYYSNAPYYQYWSDPIALSGINPDSFSYKRVPFYIVEKKAFKYADQIIFGTKTLYSFNSKLYKKLAYKMRYVDVAYLLKDSSVHKITRKQNEFIYAGNYHSSIRNILPLYNAFNKLGKNFHLTIFGGSDLVLASTDNVTINSRIPAKDLENIEHSFKNSVCLLNHSCIQIPGKTFYQIDTDQNILVIADGKYKNEIIEYLKTFNRFYLCDNDENSIINALVEIAKQGDYVCPNEIKDKFSPKKIAADILRGLI